MYTGDIAFASVRRIASDQPFVGDSGERVLLASMNADFRPVAVIRRWQAIAARRARRDVIDAASLTTARIAIDCRRITLPIHCLSAAGFLND